MNKLIKRRKNFFPALVINVLLWLAWLLVFFRLSPDYSIAVVLFYFFLLLALFLSLALVLGHSRRGLIVTVGIASILFLRQTGLANILNICLLVSFLTVLELYFSKN